MVDVEETKKATLDSDNEEGYLHAKVPKFDELGKNEENLLLIKDMERIDRWLRGDLNIEEMKIDIEDKENKEIVAREEDIIAIEKGVKTKVFFFFFQNL